MNQVQRDRMQRTAEKLLEVVADAPTTQEALAALNAALTTLACAAGVSLDDAVQAFKEGWPKT